MHKALSRNAVFVLFTAGVVFALAVPDLVRHGMFMDGVQYAIVSKNMAFGKGSFWFPYLSSSWQKVNVNSFLEHPPLSYYLQSKFFLMFGTSIFTEKLYCFVLIILCAYLIYKIWRLVFQEDLVLKNYWWLAILLWFSTPSVFWAFKNNMIENTVTLMVLASSYFALKAIFEKRYSFVYVLAAAVFVFLGSLCKGLPAFFPVSIFLCYFVFTNKLPLKRTILLTGIILFVPLILYSFIFMFIPEANSSLSFYLQDRLLNRINSEHTVENRFTILFWLFTDLLVSLGITVLLLALFRLSTFISPLTRDNNKMILFFSVYGLCGVLPLCLTHVQRATYFIPAVPFLSLGFAIFLSKGLNTLIARINERAIKFVSAGVVLFCLTVLVYAVSIIGKNGRDDDTLADVHQIGNSVGRNKIIGTSYEIYTKWYFQFYLLRYYEDILKVREDSKEQYLLFDKANYPTDLFEYTKQEIALNNFVLFKRNR